MVHMVSEVMKSTQYTEEQKNTFLQGIVLTEIQLNAVNSNISDQSNKLDKSRVGVISYGCINESSCFMKFMKWSIAEFKYCILRHDLDYRVNEKDLLTIALKSEQCDLETIKFVINAGVEFSEDHFEAFVDRMKAFRDGKDNDLYLDNFYMVLVPVLNSDNIGDFIKGRLLSNFQLTRSECKNIESQLQGTQKEFFDQNVRKAETYGAKGALVGGLAGGGSTVAFGGGITAGLVALGKLPLDFKSNLFLVACASVLCAAAIAAGVGAYLGFNKEKAPNTGLEEALPRGIGMGSQQPSRE